MLVMLSSRLLPASRFWAQITAAGVALLLLLLTGSALLLHTDLIKALDEMTRGLSNDSGACARIFSTPMPFAYIVHLR